MPFADKLLILANLALIFWTLGFGYLMAFKRVSAVKTGTTPSAFYVTYNKGAEADALAVFTRHFSNLYETPLLFYVLSALSLAAQRNDMLLAYLAVAYVVTRVLHTLIHLTINHVMLRFIAFILSTILILAMAIRLLVSVLS